jgi:hypothetical protein
LTSATTALALVVAGSAAAATPLSPTSGSSTSSTPSFSWELGSGERSYAIEISPNPAPGEFGRFADDEDRRFEFLADTQTTFTVGDAAPLFAGTWYWHVETDDQNFDTHFTPTLAFQVPDEPPISAVEIDYLACVREVQLSFEHTDNSRNRFVRWQLAFLRHRNSGRSARVSGSTTEEFGTYEDFDLPEKLKLGKTYWARLRITDPAGQIATAGAQRLRLERC